MNIYGNMLDDIILNALREDVGTGDITTETTIPQGRMVHGLYRAKENGVLCGLGVTERVFQLINPEIEFRPLATDGANVKVGDIVAEVHGPAGDVLTGERTGLKLLPRMSGIATRTAEAVKQGEGTSAKICDTRKTTPGMRILEKYAVRVGGGTNHRFNLADGILIKDNHIVAAGSITNAVRSARANAPHTLKIEVEVETFEQLDEALAAGADIIMLDNMSTADMKKAVEIVAGRAVTEASGNMGDRNLTEVAACGVDLISIGALTHSVRALDISLKFTIE